ncbi:MAG: hypothetical protein WD040_02270 [Anaerolineales bacterium]
MSDQSWRAGLAISADGQLSGGFRNVMGTTGSIEITGSITPEQIDLRYTLIPGTGTGEGTLVLEHQ